MPQRNIEGQYPYAYQGQEKDAETGMEAFELRLWDARIGRWLTTDPYGQYASPYLGMGNNPVSRVDPDGGEDDWVSKDGKNFYWDESITNVDQASAMGLIYGGATRTEVIQNFGNDFLPGLFGHRLNFDLNSYYEAKIPLVVQDVFNRDKWEQGLIESNDPRIKSPLFNNENNELSRLLKGQTATIKGTVCLDGVECGYTAYLSGADNVKGLSLFGFFDEHPQRNWTLAVANGGFIEGQIFSISNSTSGKYYPVIGVKFNSNQTYENAVKWYFKYHTNN